MQLLCNPHKLTVHLYKNNLISSALLLKNLQDCEVVYSIYANLRPRTNSTLIIFNIYQECARVHVYTHTYTHMCTQLLIYTKSFYFNMKMY